jgi:hypothetical protein
MKVLIAHSQDDRISYEDCECTISRTSPYWTLDHYVVDDGDSAEPNTLIRQKLHEQDYFVLIHTRRIRDSYFDNGQRIRDLLREDCKAIVYRPADAKRPDGFDGFEHREGLSQLEMYFREQQELQRERLQTQSKRDKISELFKSILSVNGLIYLGYYYYATQSQREDLLDDYIGIGDNSPFFNRLSAFMKAKKFSAKQLRTIYDRIFETCLSNEVVIERILGPAQQGDLVRAVLDVRTGAFYLNEIEGSHYVCGVTINQYDVYNIEHTMKAICDRVTEIESSSL